MKKIANEVFDTYEKWEAFIELIQNKKSIEEVWASEFQTKIKTIVGSEFSKWKVEFDDLSNLFFSPKELETRQSIELWIEHSNNIFKFSFWANGAVLDTNKANKILRNHINVIEDLLHDKIVITDNMNESYLFKHPIKYDLPFLGSNSSLLSFHLNKSMPEQVINFIRPFLKSDAIYNLVCSINSSSL